MSIDDPDDDEDWYDDDHDLDDQESVACPECGGRVYSVSDKCPACGYWLSDADRRAMWPDASKPLWMRATAAIVLVALLLSVLGIMMVVF